MSKSKKKQEIPKCIFCEKSPLSREHFWPKWMREIVPTDTRTNHNNRITTRDYHSILGNTVPQVGVKKAAGPVSSVQMKKVCDPCNNGWMSGIENGVKATLSSLILNDSILISPQQQEAVIKWAVLKTIIGQYAHSDFKTINAEERRLFYSTNMPPAGWMVWIAKSELFRACLGIEKG